MWKLRTVCLLSCWALFGCNDTDNGTNAADVQSSVDIVAPVNDVVTNPETDAATEDIQSDTATPADEDTVVVCEPDCGEKDCGDDGCGGSCGECDDGSSCEDHVCVADCVPDCEGKECGPDKCGGSCGSCPNDAPLCHAGVCEALCVPDCEGKECGFDGCAGSCGGCPGDVPYCDDEGQCVPDPACGDEGCKLVGKVVAPEGTVPINGALVYLVLAPPPPLNEGLFCNKCFNLNEETPQTTTAPDGTFELMSPKSGSYYLVSQKGSFRRVRALEVTGGEQPVPIELTTMPGVSDATTGDAVPRMAVAVGGFDHIEDTLSQLGVEDYASYEGSAFGGGGGDTAIDLLLDWEKISQYQVVFVPCAGSWFDGDLSNPVFLQNIRDFVSAGGKLYVTDWSYDLINTVFPGVITWLGDTGAVGSAQGSVYDAPAVVNDAGLQAWLESQNITDFTLEANWTTIDEVSSYTAPNELNFPTEFEPTVWVNADVPSQGVRPATVSFQYGCGRVLFSTYHTETSGSAILPQELALLYTVLEVNLCIGTGSF